MAAKHKGGAERLLLSAAGTDSVKKALIFGRASMTEGQEGSFKKEIVPVGNDM